MELASILCLIILFILFCFILKKSFNHVYRSFLTVLTFSVLVLSVYLEYRFGTVSNIHELRRLFVPANCNTEGKGNFLFLLKEML